MSFGVAGITNIGKVLDEDNVISNGVFTVSVPTTTTAGTRNINLFGKKRVISVQGINFGEGYAGATVEARIKAFIADVEDWVNNGIQSTLVVTDSFGNSYNCICTNFRWSRKETTPNWIIFSMTLIEGGAIS